MIKLCFYKIALFFPFFFFLSTSAQTPDSLIQTVKEIEERLDGRIGVAVYDDNSGRAWQYKENERFPMCSTFKALAVAALLARVDAGDEQLERVATFKEDELVSYSPVTEKHTGEGGMTLAALCEATLATSDNTAANLILKAVGGPASLTAFVRATGDTITRLDRWETELNEGLPGDVRDTTTPRAIAMTLKKLLLSDVMSEPSRRQLIEWLNGNRVADALLRASLPEGWVIADRSGAGGYGTRGIIAILWPPAGKPVSVAIYITETEASFDERNKAIAGIGVAIVNAINKDRLFKVETMK